MFLNSLLLKKFRRQDTSPFQGPCFDLCRNAAIAFQQNGTSPSVCEPGSDVLEDLGSCRTCIDQSRSNSTSGSPRFGPPFLQYLDYCAIVSRNETQVGRTTSYQIAVSSMSAAIASLANDASLLDLTTATLSEDSTKLPSSVRTTSLITLTSSADPFPVPLTTPASTSSTPPAPNNTSKIAGAAVGSVVGLAVLLTACVFVLRRQKRRLPAQLAANEAGEKPMLHWTHVEPDPKELPGDGSAAQHTGWGGSIVEMPANEVAGRELDASIRVSTSYEKAKQ